MKNTQPIRLILLAAVVTITLEQCTVDKYLTRQAQAPDERLVAYFLQDRHRVFIHQGDQEYLFDSVKLTGATLTGRLKPMPKEQVIYPEPDTILGEHHWELKKRATWMKGPHIYVHEGFDIPKGVIYFLPEDMRMIRSFYPGGEPKEADIRIGSNFFEGMVKGILTLSFNALTSNIGSGRSQSSFHSSPQPRGSSGNANQAKIRTFPGKSNQTP